MKKENRKLAQQQRAAERKKKELTRKIKKFLVIFIPLLAVLLLVAVLVWDSVRSDSSDNASASASSAYSQTDTNNGGTDTSLSTDSSLSVADGNTVKTFSYETHENICTAETSETMRYLLEKVVSEGTGKNAKIEGFSIGGKTATSQTLPRSDHKYISSFLGFAPADNPQVLVLVVINNPQGIYYGGTIAAPVAKEIFENILPYLDK